MLLEELYQEFSEVFSSPEVYLEIPESLNKDLIATSKRLYDLLKESQPDSHGSSLKKLLVEGFDNEQIWQEIQLQNAPALQEIKNKNKRIKGEGFILDRNRQQQCHDNLSENVLKYSGESDGENSEEGDLYSSSDSDTDHEKNDEMELSGNESIGSGENILKEKTYKPSIVDDDFFKLREMEEFLDQQDKQEEQLRDGEHENDGVDKIDYFNDVLDIDDDDEDKLDAKDLKFKDFFSAPLKKKRKTAEKQNEIKDLERNESDEHEERYEEREIGEGMQNIKENEVSNEVDNEEDLKSIFEKKQEMMKKKIERLEEVNLSDKPWQLIGETNSKQRPLNSLLEEHVSFDHTSAGAPVITEETTETLEDIIKQRVKDQAWDDVERKQKPSVQPYEFKKAPELNMEKSKVSLAEVYEKEYLKQAEDDKEEKEDEEHAVIKEMMEKLFVKLDALSNFYFTPKPPKPELKIITNTPSIQMEEVLPITMTTASQLAPEEIHDKKKGDVKGDGEKLDTDKKRERRQKKLKKKFSIKDNEDKEKLKAKNGKISKSSTKRSVDVLKKGTRNTIVNEKNSDVKSVKSSNVFFTKLQDEARKSISSQKTKNANEKGKKKKTAEFLKL